MELIPVPKPSKKAMNPDRTANALLMAQVSHLQHAERRLPLKYRSEIYTHAIRSEGEAAEYIRHVTEAIHRAHDDAQKRRDKRKRGLTIAAAAQRTKKKKKSKNSQRGKKK
jgi:hypothetical protein